jgi:8-oxo-dGTP pyrophosphatase MutT (NUDIX family)
MREAGLTSRWPTTNYTSGNFVLCGGCVLFRRVRAAPSELQVCLLQVGQEWLLAKRRKDRGEDIVGAALRETTEETGYPCMLLPVNMHTRAPAPGADVVDTLGGVLVSDCVELFMITIRAKAENDIKLIAWYIAEVDESGVRDGEGEVKKIEGTMMPSETYYVSEFMMVDTALSCLTFETDREVLAKAVELVEATPSRSSD